MEDVEFVLDLGQAVVGAVGAVAAVLAGEHDKFYAEVDGIDVEIILENIIDHAHVYTPEIDVVY